MILSEAAKQLMNIAGCGRSAAYEALKLDGRFGSLLQMSGDGLLGMAVVVDTP